MCPKLSKVSGIEGGVTVVIEHNDAQLNFFHCCYTMKRLFLFLVQKKVPSAVEQDNEQALEQVKAED